MSQNTRLLLMHSLRLPQFDTIDGFAKVTGLSSKLLYCLSMRSESYYKPITISKRNGGTREISIPSYTLNIVQCWILKNILNKILPSDRAMAFRKGKTFGHKKNAFYHSHTLYGLSLDIKEFFPSITSQKVYTVFSNIGYNNFAATILTNLCTLNGKLPQGSASSPALSNIVSLSLDKRLIGLCEKKGIRFTRYADDMYFSCDDKALLLKNFAIIKEIIVSEGFTVNIRKTHFHTPSNKKRITGVTVVANHKDDVIQLKAPKELKQKIRAEIFRSIISGNYEEREHILGEISYVEFIEKENKHEYLVGIKKYISRTAVKIQYFSELVSEYNKNLLFADLEKVDFQNVADLSNEDYELDFRLHNIEKRKEYLMTRGIRDICTYQDCAEL